MRIELSELKNYPSYKNNVEDRIAQRLLITDDYSIAKFKVKGVGSLADLSRSNRGGMFLIFASKKLFDIFNSFVCSNYQVKPLSVLYRKNEKPYFLLNFYEAIDGIDIQNSIFVKDKNSSFYLDSSKNPPIPCEEVQVRDYVDFKKKYNNDHFALRARKLCIRKDTGFDFFRYEDGFCCTEEFKQKCEQANILGLKFTEFPLVRDF